MNLPDLNRIVDTFVPADARGPEDFEPHIEQLRRDVLVPVRSLQKQNRLNWFGFLLHDASALGLAPDSRVYIHIWLEPSSGWTLEDFAAQLPAHFQRPRTGVYLHDIAGVEQSSLQNHDWSYAWHMLGVSSEWVLALLENHGPNSFSRAQALQFLHFSRNPLLLWP
jgi:hypothetical protein